MQVSVRDNNVDQALRALKKKLQREGVFREMKLRQHFEKPSEKKSPRKSRGHSPRAQAGTQKIAARRYDVKHRHFVRVYRPSAIGRGFFILTENRSKN